MLELCEERDAWLREANLYKVIPKIILPCSMRFDLKKIDNYLLNEV